MNIINNYCKQLPHFNEFFYELDNILFTQIKANIIISYFFNWKILNNKTYIPIYNDEWLALFSTNDFNNVFFKLYNIKDIVFNINNNRHIPFFNKDMYVSISNYLINIGIDNINTNHLKDMQHLAFISFSFSPSQIF